MIKIGRQVKCPKCNKMNNKEDTVSKNNRYYCKECIEELKAEKESKKSDWDILFDCICRIYGVSRPNGFMFKQLKQYREDPYNYTDSGMYATLVYYYETLGNPVLEGTGLGIIPYYYDKVKQHYENMFKVEDSLENYKEDESYNIKINLTERNELMKSLQKTLDYNDIDWSEEDDSE